MRPSTYKKTRDCVTWKNLEPKAALIFDTTSLNRSCKRKKFLLEKEEILVALFLFIYLLSDSMVETSFGDNIVARHAAFQSKVSRCDIKFSLFTKDNLANPSLEMTILYLKSCKS